VDTSASKRLLRGVAYEAVSSSLSRLLALTCLIFIGIQATVAQVNRATITGTVADSSGAVLAGVEVNATNTGTNVSTKTVSNGDGIHAIPNLFPGHYSVEFQKEGFEKQKHLSVTLESTQVARIDAQLKVGSVKESLIVTADAPRSWIWRGPQ
jgi:carboxypeptidase family protein